MDQVETDRVFGVLVNSNPNNKKMFWLFRFGFIFLVFKFFLLFKLILSMDSSFHNHTNNCMNCFISAPTYSLVEFSNHLAQSHVGSLRKNRDQNI